MGAPLSAGKIAPPVQVYEAALEFKLEGDGFLRTERLGEVKGLRLYGPEELEQRGGVLSFTLGEIHPHDVAQVLDEEGIAVRAGHHCTMPLHRRLGVQATTRASFSVYSTVEEVDALAAGLDKTARFFA